MGGVLLKYTGIPKGSAPKVQAESQGVMLFGNLLGIELTADGSNNDDLLFGFNIYLKACVILSLLTFSSA